MSRHELAIIGTCLVVLELQAIKASRPRLILCRWLSEGPLTLDQDADKGEGVPTLSLTILQAYCCVWRSARSAVCYSASASEETKQLQNLGSATALATIVGDQPR